VYVHVNFVAPPPSPLGNLALAGDATSVLIRRATGVLIRPVRPLSSKRPWHLLDRCLRWWRREGAAPRSGPKRSQKGYSYGEWPRRRERPRAGGGEIPRRGKRNRLPQPGGRLVAHQVGRRPRYHPALAFVQVGQHPVEKARELFGVDLHTMIILRAFYSTVDP